MQAIDLGDFKKHLLEVRNMSEQVQTHIHGLLTEAKEAFESENWPLLRERAKKVLLLDPDNEDARTYRDAADRAIPSVNEEKQPPGRAIPSVNEEKQPPGRFLDTIRDHINAHVAGYVQLAVGIVLAVIGLGVALYFGLQPEKTRQPQLSAGDPILVYDPEVTTVFRLETTDETTPHLFRQEPIEESVGLNQQVWAVNFAVWNSGELDIQRQQDVLSDYLAIDIGSPDQQPTIVWELRTTALSRKEIDFQLLDKQKQEVNGFLRVPFDFKYLSQNDGAQIQLTYSGPKNIPLTLNGQVRAPQGSGEKKDFNLWPLVAWPVSFFVIGAILSSIGFVLWLRKQPAEQIQGWLVTGIVSLAISRVLKNPDFAKND